MPEQRQQTSYKEENDILEDDTLKTPVVHPSSPLSSASATTLSTFTPTTQNTYEGQTVLPITTQHASPLPEHTTANHDNSETDFLDTLQMPAIKKTLTTNSSASPKVSENTVDILPMGQIPEASTQQIQNERAALLSLIAEILSATVTYAQKELVTVLASHAQHALIQQTAQPLPTNIRETTATNTTNTTNTTFSTPQIWHDETTETFETFSTSQLWNIETSETPETFSTPARENTIIALQEPTAAIIDTPRPQEAALSEIDEREAEHPEAETPLEQIALPPTPITPRPYVAPIFTRPSGQLRTRTSVVHRRKRLSWWHRILAVLFSVLLIASLILLWRDLSASHLILSTIDPGSGSFVSQQDMASYPDHPSLTTAVYNSSSLIIGLHNDATTDGTHRVFVFHSDDGQWNEQTQFSTPLTHGTVQLASTRQILINTPQAIQVRSADGHLLWTAASDQPITGVHTFQTMSNQHTLYTIKSLSQSQVVAYDLQSGQTNWVQTLDDTLNNTPPFLLSAHTLYIASDHNIYALNNNDGTLQWQQPYSSRTLLLTQQGQTPLLLAAGVHGLLALNPNTGHPLWTFKGQASDALTTPELYQATTATDITTPSLIYTTGITWRIPQIQEQLWLYAVDAHTGAQVWAKQVGDTFVSADAGRLLSPQLDTTHHLVLLQQQASSNSQHIVAFDATNGTLRWSTTLNNSTPTTTALLETSDGTPLVVRLLATSSDLFWIFSPLRLLLLGVLLGSAIILCILLLFSLPAMLTPPLASATHTTPNKYSGNKSVRRARIALALIICLSIGTFGILRLTQPQETITQLSTHTGTVAWQHTISQPTYPLLTSAHNSLVLANADSNSGNNNALTRLQSLNTTGSVNWQTFASEGTFAIPTLNTPDTSSASTILVTLSGHGLRPYQFAPDDPAYQHAIDAVLVLYLFDQANGHILWQHVAIGPTEQRQGTILGMDTHDLYLASTPIADPSASLLVPNLPSTGLATQLTAINRDTGNIDWHIFGPSTNTSASDSGTLLLQHGLAIWQVQGVVYAIDTAMGQITWRHPLQSDATAILLQEEQLELATPDTLLVNRLDGVHALSLTSGNELWHLPQLGIATLPIKASFAVAGHILLVYDNGHLLAYDLQSRQNLWSQTQPSSIEHLRVSYDGSLLFLLLLNTVQGNTLAPSVVALDAQTGATRWTFTLLGQTPLSAASPDSFLYSNGTLFVTSCINTETRICSNQYLYALNATTGKIVWKLNDISISHLHVSQDGSLLIIHTTSSTWEALSLHL